MFIEEKFENTDKQNEIVILILPREVEIHIHREHFHRHCS